jgi:hypothetical protein
MAALPPSRITAVRGERHATSESLWVPLCILSLLAVKDQLSMLKEP